MTITRLQQENGFTLMELMVASVCTIIVLGSAVALTSQIQTGYRRQIESSAAEQEGRYALEWIGRYLRGAGNNPFGVTESDCPGENTDFLGIIINPDGDEFNDDITLQMDSNPPDGKVGGLPGDCQQENEHVTISFDSDTKTITFLDEAVGELATTRTDNVIEGLNFVYLDSDREETAEQDEIFYVQVQIRVRTRTVETSSGNPDIRTMQSEIRVRDR